MHLDYRPFFFSALEKLQFASVGSVDTLTVYRAGALLSVALFPFFEILYIFPGRFVYGRKKEAIRSSPTFYANLVFNQDTRWLQQYLLKHMCSDKNVVSLWLFLVILRPAFYICLCDIYLGFWYVQEIRFNNFSLSGKRYPSSYLNPGSTYVCVYTFPKFNLIVSWMLCRICAASAGYFSVDIKTPMDVTCWRLV